MVLLQLAVAAATSTAAATKTTSGAAVNRMLSYSVNLFIYLFLNYLVLTK